MIVGSEMASCSQQEKLVGFLSPEEAANWLVNYLKQNSNIQIDDSIQQNATAK